MTLTERHIVDRAKLGRHETVRVAGLPHNCQSMILLADFSLGLLVLLTEGLMLISLNSDGSWLDVTMMGTLDEVGVIDHHLLA